MRRNTFVFINAGLFFCMQSISQCPVRETIRQKAVAVLSDSNPQKLNSMLHIVDLIKECHYPDDSIETSLLWDIGWMYFDRHEYLTAESYLKQTVNTIRLNINSHSIRAGDIVTTCYWVSDFYKSMNNGPERRKYLDSCIAFALQLHSQTNILFLQALFQRLKYFYDIGEYRLCIDDAILCEKYAGQYLKTITKKSEIITGTDIEQSSIGWNVNALLNLKEFDKAEELLKNKISEYHEKGRNNYLAFTYSKLGEVQEVKENYKGALSYYMNAFKLYCNGHDNFSSKQTLNIIGDKIYFKHFSDYNKAMVFFRSALTFKNHDKKLVEVDSMEELNIYGKIANIYVERGQYDSAFVSFDSAFSRIAKGLDEKNILLYKDLNEFSRLHKIDYLISLLTDKGDAFKRRFESTGLKEYLTSAEETYAVADKVLERIIKAQFELESRLYWRKNFRRLYENAIQACYLANDGERAFYFFERSRAILLNIQLTEQNWLGKDDISRLTDLKKTIVYFEGLQKDAVVNSTEYARYGDTLTIRNQELYYLEQRIKQNNPLYYQNNDTSIATVRDIRKNILKDHQVLFEIFAGEKAVYSLLIDNNNVSIREINKAEYDSTAKSYISYISNRNLLNRDVIGFRAISYKLYQLLFQNDSLPPTRIIISPEGQYFPFESLISKNKGDRPVYFFADHAVSYAYSARYLLNNFFPDSNSRSGNFLGIAPVHCSSNLGLTELVGSDISLKRIGTYIPKSNYIVGMVASRRNFFLQFPLYKVIQLYTHASNSSGRKEPIIYFNDSAIYSSELVLGAKPATQLIVLSACETGVGKEYKGEGVFSFNRAFAALGIPSSITNLWSVDNVSTYKLTELFYKYLAKGLPLDIALQKAKLEFIQTSDRQNQLPYYWAAPILVGKTDPILLNKPFQWKYVLAGAGLAGLAFLGWQKIKKKKSLTPAPGTIQTAA